MGHDQAFRLHPAWSIAESDRALLVHGGADARYAIDIEGPDPSFFGDLTPDREFTRDALSAPDQRVLEQLLTASIVVPVLRKATTLRVAVFGDDAPFTLDSRPGYRVVPTGRPHDLAVLVRATATYADLLARVDYGDVATPHLFVDVAFHHTVSIGPLVFPGRRRAWRASRAG